MRADDTFDKRLGMVNRERRPPVAEAGGRAWMTSKEANGVILICPDRYDGQIDDLEALPKGIDAITTNGERITT